MNIPLFYNTNRISEANMKTIIRDIDELLEMYNGRYLISSRMNDNSLIHVSSIIKNKRHEILFKNFEKNYYRYLTKDLNDDLYDLEDLKDIKRQCENVAHDEYLKLNRYIDKYDPNVVIIMPEPSYSLYNTRFENLRKCAVILCDNYHANIFRNTLIQFNGEYNISDFSWLPGLIVKHYSGKSLMNTISAIPYSKQNMIKAASEIA